MNLSAIFSKTGKGVQEASGKTSHLSRGDRAVLSAIDGKTPLEGVQKKFDKLVGRKFEALIQQLDKDGFIREVSSADAQPAPAPVGRAAASPPRAATPPKSPGKAPAAGGDDDVLDFTQVLKPKGGAAAPQSEAERRAMQEVLEYKARQEAEAKAKGEVDLKAKAAAEAKARADAEAEAGVKAVRDALEKARKASEDKARLEAELRSKLEAERKGREDAERRASEAADRARRELEEKAKRDAEELRQRLEAEMNARLELERKAREEEDRKRREEEDRRRKDEEERRAKEDAERRAREEEERRKRDEEKRRKEEEERRAKQEAERRAKEEAEQRAKADAERRAQEEAEQRAKAEAERRAKEEAERQAKAEAERRAKEEAELRARVEAEQRAKEEEQRRAREEEDRRKREEKERRRKEDEERRAKEEAERLAREAAERKRREDEDHRRAEEEKRRKEEDERRAGEEAERVARDEAERKRRDDEDRKRAEEEKRRKDDDERRAREEAERKAKEEALARSNAGLSTSATLMAIPPVAAAAPPPPPPPSVPSPPPAPSAADSGLGDSLLADLEAFGQREEEERKAKEEAERQAKEAAARKAKQEAERKAQEEAGKKQREEEARRRREDETRQTREAAEQRAREESERKAQEDAQRKKLEERERKRKALEALAAREDDRLAAERAASAYGVKKGGADVGVTEDDLGMDDVKMDDKALSATALEREPVPAAAAGRRPMTWGKPAAIALFVLLIGGVGALNLMPISTAEYEKAASDAVGVPVKIGSARLSVITGIAMRFEGVSVGAAVKIRSAHGSLDVGSLFGAKKSFSRMELEGVSMPQSLLGDAVLGKISGENLRIGRVVIKQVKFDGPLALPALDVEVAFAGDGALQSVSLRGGDKLNVQLSPKGNDIGFEIGAGSLALPFLPALTLSEFGMKGSANRSGVTASEFDGRAFDGVISGSAKIRWGANWLVEGEVRARGANIAVFAPALVSEGKVDARGAYSMSGPNPATLSEKARVQGEFKIEKGVLGSFDLSRALQTGGAQTGGRTPFTELTGQAVYDKGAVKVTNVAMSSGAMNAGANLDIDANGALAGRIAADVRTPNQTLRATLTLSGKIQDPVIRK